MQNVSDKSYTENQNTNFMFNNIFFSEIRAVNEKMWKHIVGDNHVLDKRFGFLSTNGGCKGMQQGEHQAQ